MALLMAVWDGEEHEMPVGEQFLDTGCADVISDWEELDDDAVLDPFESPSLEPVLRSTGDAPSARFPLARTEQAWATLSINLQAFARVAQVPIQIQERINHETGAVRFVIQTKEFYSERV